MASAEVVRSERIRKSKARAVAAADQAAGQAADPAALEPVSLPFGDEEEDGGSPLDRGSVHSFTIRSEGDLLEHAEARPVPAFVPALRMERVAPDSAGAHEEFMDGKEEWSNSWREAAESETLGDS